MTEHEQSLAKGNSFKVDDELNSKGWSCIVNLFVLVMTMVCLVSFMKCGRRQRIGRGSLWTWELTSLTSQTMKHKECLLLLS